DAGRTADALQPEAVTLWRLAHGRGPSLRIPVSAAGEVRAVIAGGRVRVAGTADHRVMRQHDCVANPVVEVFDGPAVGEESFRHAMSLVLPPAVRRAARSRCMTGMCLSMLRK